MKKLQIRKGEYEELTFEEALEKYKPLIRKLVNRYYGVYDYNDLFQTASIALWEAYEEYDIDRGNTFLTLAYSKIDYAIRNYHRDRTYKFSNKYSKVREIMTCDILELLERDKNNYYLFDFEKVIDINEVISIIRDFKANNRKIWYLYACGFNNSEIARKIGVSGQWVAVCLKEDAKVIRKRLKIGA
ncbi:sigma-70 family RNA polymerase sigma factor [Wukongibacter sp. M2B1]|uniref:sigma-70 family RNA polymerase sigma factor n=1 Tax=Wukongibacter sp. M2B1 TaxID=3088895 RepID=UPI003D790251